MGRSAELDRLGFVQPFADEVNTRTTCSLLALRLFVLSSQRFSPILEEIRAKMVREDLVEGAVSCTNNHAYSLVMPAI